MRSTQSSILGLALHVTAVIGYDYNTDGAINHDAEPYVIAMVNNASIGPDGTYTSGFCKYHANEMDQQGRGGTSLRLLTSRR